MTNTIRRLLVRGTAAALLAGLLGGLPAALVTFVGWPLPTTVPTPDTLTGWLTAPLSDRVILDALAVAAWLLWAAFIPAVAGEARAAWHSRGTPITHRHTRNPLRIAAATLIAALALGTMPATASTTSAAAATPTGDTRTSAPAATTRADTVPTNADGGEARSRVQVVAARGPVTVHVGTARYRYVVDRGDTLSKIARDWLRDPDRWPEICELNWHRHWPSVGGKLSDCNLIYPGWDLHLPTDATPPDTARPTPADPPAPDTQPEAPASPAPAPPGADVPGADGAPTSATPTRQETTSPEPTATPSTARPPTAPPQPAPTPGQLTAAPSTAPRAPASQPSDRLPAPPTASAPRAAASPSPSTPGAVTPSAGPATPPAASAAPGSAVRDGISLPGSFLPWTLAASIAAAVAMVWLQRRRRHLPGALDDDPHDLPDPVLRVHRDSTRAGILPAHPDLADRAAAVPTHPDLPTGGIGLVGAGAEAAARAALTAALATGGPRDPDHQGEVIIHGTTLTTLIGADAAALGPWPRLHVADDLDHALALLETALLHRARLLDEHDATDLDTLRTRAPDEEPLPPVLLITETPPAGARMRARTALTLGTDVQISALLLGHWPHGTTVHVDADGYTSTTDPDDPADPGGTTRPGLPGVPERIGVLDTDTAVAVLATLREAHTGHRPAITTPASPSPVDAPADSDTEQDDSPAHPSSAEHGDTDLPHDAAPGAGDSSSATPSGADTASAPPVTVKARLCLFGTPRVENVTAPGQPLRAKAAELAAFLACHPEGADTRTVGEHLEPDTRLRYADTRVHTNVSNLRHVFARAAGHRKLGYVTKHASRYRLDPDTVEVDLWELRDLLAAATTAPPEQRTDLLRRACALYTAPLADTCDYDWVEPHREKARQQATEAHLLLAETLTPTDPRAAADTLATAIRLDPYNEALYRAAMHAHHQFGDSDAIRALLRTLTIALTDLDTEPTEGTIELARRLRHTPPTPVDPANDEQG